MIFVGNRLFISTGLNPILTFQLGDDGALTLVNSLYTNVQNSGLLLATPDGKYLYLENESARSIWAYRIGSAGDLSYLYTLSIGAALGNSPGDMVMDRSGTHLYVTVQHEGIYGFSIDAAGGLVALSGSPFAVVNPTVASLALVE